MIARRQKKSTYTQDFAKNQSNINRAEVHIARNTNRSLPRSLSLLLSLSLFLIHTYIYRYFLNERRSIWKYLLLSIFVLVAHSYHRRDLFLARFPALHIQQTHQYSRVSIEDVENSLLRRFFMLVSRLISQNKKKEKPIEIREKIERRKKTSSCSRRRRK